MFISIIKGEFHFRKANKRRYIEQIDGELEEGNKSILYEVSSVLANMEAQDDITMAPSDDKD